MPVIVWWLIGGGITALGIGGGLKFAGDGVDEAGNGALKLAGAAAIGVGAWIAFQKLAK